jgi:hypothetical protein
MNPNSDGLCWAMCAMNSARRVSLYSFAIWLSFL